MAINSDGYILVDFSDVDFRYINQTIDGLYKRMRQVIGTNKFVLVINGDGKSPMPAAVSIKNNQYVIEAYIYTFSIAANDNLHITKHSSVDEIIDDDHESLKTTYSSSKINNLIDAIDSKHNYSENESIIGTWIDGKPVYEKSYSVTSPAANTSANIIDVTELNIDTLVSLEGNINSSSNSIATGNSEWRLWVRRNWESTSKDYVACFISFAGYASQPCVITLQYTKSSD